MVGVIAHTNHNRLHFLQSRITHHGNLVVQFLWIVYLIRYRIAHIRIACAFCSVASVLGIGEHTQWEIKCILLQPHFQPIRGTLVVVQALWSQYQRYLILIVVILQVRTQTNKTGQVFVPYRLIIGHTFRVYEHLQTLILTHVIGHILIHRTRVFGLQVIHFQHHCLLILCDQLRLSGVCLARDTGWQHIVHRRTIRVLLYIHCLHIQRPV